MKLGVFSMSLSVKDLKASKDFYEKIGFEVFAGDMESHYLIMKNESTLIGLFQDMFDSNILTFTPGWDQDAQTLEEYIDVRELKEKINKAGIATESESFEEQSGPGSFMITDPDGNQILFDQHI